MVLELHVWGPAFELPSIDAQCLAAVAYLHQSLPRDRWVLVPTSDPRVSPLGELPALHDDELWVAGYSGIVEHVQNASQGDWNLDQNLSEQQQADKTALTAFLISRGQPLLDLCLYVSSDNYHDSTRPALARILSWPNSWTVPHQLRDQAKKRSEHLGLSSLDVDTAQEQENKKENEGLTAQIPKSLRMPKQTVTSLLGRSHQRNRFRLDAVTEDFFEPLSDMLRDKKWLLGNEPTSVDYLATAYLALMQTSHLEHNWLSVTLRTKYPTLHSWARKGATQAFSAAADGSSLPWQEPAARSVSQICHEVLEGCIGSIPVIGWPFQSSEVAYSQASCKPTGQSRALEKQLQLARLRQRRDLYLEVLSSTVASAGLIAWLLHEGMLRLPRWSRPEQTQRFGEAGALLGLR